MKTQAGSTQASFEPAEERVLSLTDIKKTYHLGKTEVNALRGVGLEVKKGAFLALMGPSGSGKSTLLHICGLIDTPDEGKVFFLGKDARAAGEKERTLWRRRTLGFVFQGFHLVPVLNVEDNVEFPLLLLDMDKEERRKRLRWILDRTGLTPFSRHLPDQLSGGQRQRVAIARALVKRPILVIADEPTANLDTETATHVVDLMHELGKEEGTTFLIATHDERMAKRCERAIRMQDGKMVQG